MTKKRVLIIDDEHALTEAISDYLSAAGHVCLSANDSAAAMALLNRTRFDVVLTDISLSDGSDTEGLQIVSHIRGSRLPTHVVIMTAHETKPYEGEAARLAARLLRKPIALGQLSREIDAAPVLC